MDFARRHIREVVWFVPENVMELSRRGLALYISLYFAAQIVGCDHCVFGQKVNLYVLANFDREFEQRVRLYDLMVVLFVFNGAVNDTAFATVGFWISLDSE